MITPSLITGLIYERPEGIKRGMFLSWVNWLIDLHIECDVNTVLNKTAYYGAR